MSTGKMDFIIIDDSKLDCFIAEKVIQNSGRGENIKSFMVATDALGHIKQTAQNNNKTVVLVDIQMPVMNGFEFIEAFEREFPEGSRGNYILTLLSSSINETDIIRAKGYKSVHKFLNKPLTKNTLDQILENV
jgi:CheY-like chemotaxis protein